MKEASLIFLLFLSLVSYPQLDSLKGPVKKVKETGTADFIKIPFYLRETSARQRYLDQETIFWEFKPDMYPRHPKETMKEYDKNGRLTKSVHFNTPGRPFYSTGYYEYDTSGNLARSRYEFRDSAYYSWEETNYKYIIDVGEDARVAMKITYRSDAGHFSFEAFLYDKDNRLVETRETSSSGTKFLHRFLSNAEGNLVLEESFRVGRKELKDSVTHQIIFIDTIDSPYQILYKYDSDGRLRQKSEGCTPGDDNWCKRIDYEYDIEKRLLKILHYRKDTVHSWRKYEYFNDHLIKRITWHSKSAPDSRNSVDYFYEEKELTRALSRVNDMTYTFDFEYVLDRYKNWTEQRKYLNNELLYTRKRTITYWD